LVHAGLDLGVGLQANELPGRLDVQATADGFEQAFQDGGSVATIHDASIVTWPGQAARSWSYSKSNGCSMSWRGNGTPVPWRMGWTSVCRAGRSRTAAT